MLHLFFRILPFVVGRTFCNMSIYFIANVYRISLIKTDVQPRGMEKVLRTKHTHRQMCVCLCVLSLFLPLPQKLNKRKTRFRHAHTCAIRSYDFSITANNVCTSASRLPCVFVCTVKPHQVELNRVSALRSNATIFIYYVFTMRSVSNFR